MKKQYGRYQVIRRLGGGGMAQVYLGFDPHLQRQVAIKVITALLDNDQMRERFKHEAVAMAQLNHQSIVPIHDFGYSQDGHPYLVMRLMQGGSLADRIKQGVFSLAKAAQLLEQLALAIDFAHGHTMVHRDLKPENILLDKQGHPYIADFGLVKLLNVSLPWTKTGKMMGSPPYMSPEQGRGHSIDERTDIYALGVITFEMLTGKWPYQSDNALGFVYQHTYAPIPDICALNNSLPAALQPIIERVLAKEPQDRYATAGEFATAIKGLLGRQVVTTALQPIISLPTAEECLRRGNEYYNQQAYQKAIAQYTQAMQLEPKYVYAHLNRGLAYYVTGLIDNAINDYNQAAQLNPKSATTFYHRGLAYQHKGLLYEAISDYNEALRINPNHAEARSALLALRTDPANYQNTGKTKQSTRPQFPPQLELRTMRKYLNQTFDDGKFEKFCQTNFTSVYDRFSRGMRKDEKITLLLDHCRRVPARYQTLVSALEEEVE